MAHFNDQEIADAIVHHNAGIDADDERQVLEESTPEGRPLEGCDGNPATCDRKHKHVTPYCHQCQVLLAAKKK